ncbi:MAG: beta-lactamase family protein [Oscillospiraceae bacterium]|nr:beta-lactamase family protein [Oscillospiraceae bacterium]
MKLQRSAPEKQGVKSQVIVDFLDKIKEEKHEFHSFMLLKNGKVISECWWEPYGPQYRHQMFSLSKSFTSTAIGLAVNEGLLTVDTLVADIFKKEMEELGPNVDEKMKKMTVKNLLTMGTGMEYENWGENNIKGFLSSHIKNEPGGAFFYNTLATYMQSAIITRLTGKKLVDYLKPRLFDPLDIDPYWEEDNQGINMGGFGLNITTEDIAKFGQLYLQKGSWDGKQLVPESWVNEATGKQIDNKGNALNSDDDWNQGYGYQFWMCKPKGVYRGDGMYGQFCIVMPNENAVVAITSNADTARVMNIIWDMLIPALGENNETYEDKPAQNRLSRAQKGLSHLWVNNTAPNFPAIRGLYKEETGNSELSEVYMDFNATEGVLILNYNNMRNINKKECVYRFKKGEWTDNASEMFMWGPKFLRSKTYGEWKPDENMFELYMWFYETPIKNGLKLKFNRSKTKLTVIFHENYKLDFELVKGSDICLTQ